MSTLLKPRDYQEACIDALMAPSDNGATRRAAVLPTGAGKSQPRDEPVLTPDGWRPIGDLRTGDMVIGSSGEPTMVTGVFPQGVRPMVRMTFSDDSWTLCDPDHLWSVRTKYDKADGKDYRTLTASRIAERVSVGWFIPVVEPVRCPDVDLPIDPYLMGVLLGDGGLSVEGRVLITCRDDTAELARAVLPAGVTMKRIADAGRDAATWRLGAGTGRGRNPVLSALRDLGLMGATAWHKFIPDAYKLGSVEQRLALLQGMCDTDGYVEPGKGSVEWTTVSERLAEDMRELANSLGGLAPVRTKRTTWTHLGERKVGTAFRLVVRLASGLVPVRVPRKRDAYRPHTKYLPTRRVVSVEEVESTEAVCIQVAARDHLYVTRHHLVTHNTVVFSHLIARFLAANPRQRVLVLAHTDELVTQAVKKLRVVAPHLRVGIVKAARNEVQAQVIVASVQSLRNPKRRDTIRDVGLVVVDECHHATAKTYRDILTHYGCMGTPCDRCRGVDGTVVFPALGIPCSDCLGTGLDGPPTPLVGFTATLVRGDSASLSDIWQTVAYRKDISFMIRRGYLLNPIGKRIEVDDLDLRKVKKSGGDYQAHALEEALDASLAPEIVAKAYVEHAGARSGILFAPTVDSAYTFAAELVGQGVSAEVVHGALPQEERRAILRRLESGETQVIANCMVLTEGFDSPKVSCIVIARPTRSSGLYQQMVGRGLRPDLTLPREGQDCLILDVVGASQVHGLASLVDLSAKEIRLIDGQGLIEMEDEFDLGDDLGDGDGPVRTTFYGPTVVVDFDPLADASRRVWMKTDGGTYFLSAGTGQGSVYVFVIPATPQVCDCADQCDDRAICHDSRGNEVRCGDGCQHGEWPRCVDGHHGEVPCVPCGGAGRVAGAPGTYDVVWACKDYRDRVEGKAGGVTEHVGVTLDLAFAWGEDVAADMGGLTGDMTLNKRAGWRKRPVSDAQRDKCRRMGIEIPADATSGDISSLIDTRIATRRLDPLAAHFASLTVGV